MTVKNMIDYKARLAELSGIVAHCVGHNDEGLRGHLQATRSIEIDEATYGPYVAAAVIAKASAVSALERMLEAAEAKSAKWRKNIADFKEAVVIDDSDLKPTSGIGLSKVLTELEKFELSEEVFGNLIDEAKEVQRQGIENFRMALRKCAMMALNPDGIQVDPGVTCEAMELALEVFKVLPLTENVFGEDLAKAKELHAASVKKREEILAQMRKDEAESHKKRVDEGVRMGIEHRDESSHRRRVYEASLTPEQRAARMVRMTGAAEHLYEIVCRLNEIMLFDESKGFASIDAEGLYELTQRSQALALRVEGKLN